MILIFKIIMTNHHDVWRFVPLLGMVSFLGLGVGVRAWVQARRFGSSGIVFSGGPSSRQRLLTAGAFLVPFLALIEATVAALAPDLDPWPGRVLPASLAHALRPVGAFLLFGATILMFAAQLTLGASWRIGIDRGASPGLVTDEFYRLCRHPIYLFMFVAFTGFALLVPTWLTIPSFAVAVVSFRTWVVHVEEPHLLLTYGDAYRVYAARVGRFVPGLGRLR